jgi:hypothetical protein
MDLHGTWKCIDIVDLYLSKLMKNDLYGYTWIDVVTHVFTSAFLPHYT